MMSIQDEPLFLMTNTLCPDIPPIVVSATDISNALDADFLRYESIEPII